MDRRIRSQEGSMEKCRRKKQKQQTDSEAVEDCDEWIPMDLVSNILLGLPGGSLLRFKCVSKTWNLEISNLKFTNTSEELLLSTNRSMYLMDYEVSLGKVRKLDLPFKSQKPFKVLGSCNGLLWLFMDDVSLVWNPFTGEQKKLPSSFFTFDLLDFADMGSSSILFGFGYDHSRDDYKIVWSQSIHISNPMVSTFSLRKGSWKNLSSPDYSRLSIKESRGTLINNKIYWLGKYCTLGMATQGQSCALCHGENCPRRHQIVFGIDLVDESHVVVCQPPTTGFDQRNHLMDFKGSLCFIMTQLGRKIDLWVLNENNVKLDWMKLMTIEHPENLCRFGFLEPIYFTSNGDVLMNIRKNFSQEDAQLGRRIKRKNMFYLYNPIEKSFRRIKVHGINCWSQEITYNRSIAFPTVAKRRR